LIFVVAIQKKKRQPGLFSFGIAITTTNMKKLFGISHLVFSHWLAEAMKKL
jgi:hypothetical protein